MVNHCLILEKLNLGRQLLLLKLLPLSNRNFLGIPLLVANQFETSDERVSGHVWDQFQVYGSCHTACEETYPHLVNLF